ncbi:hypothetical protein PQR39_41505 [Paraburkholderia sediminicola]|uniref:hypothetical protein n=1 Tax=Paraburkholderia sediminicola TaxID=458836 RepID=UPI0038B7FB3A
MSRASPREDGLRLQVPVLCGLPQRRFGAKRELHGRSETSHRKIRPSGIQMDWDWFFSSLAQSAAAIVGIFGAFIITRVSNNQSTFANKKNQIKYLLLDAQRISDEAQGRYVEWFVRHSNNRAMSCAESLYDKGVTSAEDLYRQANFPLYGRREEACELIQRLIALKEEEVREEAEYYRKMTSRPARSSFGLSSGLAPFAETQYVNAIPVRSRKEFFPYPTSPDTQQLNDEFDEIQKAIRQAKHHSRLVSTFLDSTEGNPEASSQVTWSLLVVMFLFFAGVIFPLAAMPLANNATPQISIVAILKAMLSLKGLLLSVVSIAFCTVLGIFLVANWRLKYSGEELTKLRPFQDTKAYAEYIAIAASNTAFIRSADAGVDDAAAQSAD